MNGKQSISWTSALQAMSALVVGVLATSTVQAVPSMARQTGYECGKCHTVFPELTPFGRQFKLGAFAMSSDKWDAKPLLERIPVSAALLASQTNTSNTDAGGTTSTDFPKDGKVVAQTAALYYGGKITDNSGALIQYNYDGLEKRWGMEMFDARYGNSLTLAGEELAYGVTLNNSPTVSDIYNSTPAWGFPHVGTAALQMPAASLVDMTLASQVGGVGLYGMWNNLIYVEVANYRSAKSGAFRFMSWGQPWGTEELAGSVINGNAPYWRVALQQDWGAHNIAIGTYGLNARVWQDTNDKSLGSNRFRDIAFDLNYQFIQGNHTASARANWINEKQTWDNGLVGSAVSNASTTLKTFRTDFHYYFQRQWGGGLQYFRTTGTSDDLRYNTSDALMGSASGSPNTKGWIAELNYLPWQNVKFALRYTKYNQFNGASDNYNGLGRNAGDNNNVFLMGWVLF